MILHIYTIVHTLISLVAIFTGVIVLFGMIAGKRLDDWTKWFLRHETNRRDVITNLLVWISGILEKGA